MCFGICSSHHVSTASLYHEMHSEQMHPKKNDSESTFDLLFFAASDRWGAKIRWLKQIFHEIVFVRDFNQQIKSTKKYTTECGVCNQNWWLYWCHFDFYEWQFFFAVPSKKSHFCRFHLETRWLYLMSRKKSLFHFTITIEMSRMKTELCAERKRLSVGRRFNIFVSNFTYVMKDPNQD